MDEVCSVKNKNTAIYTSCNSLFIPQAMTLMHSLSGVDADLYISCPDLKTQEINSLKDSKVTVLDLAQISSEEDRAKIFHRNVVEICTAIKPIALRHFLEMGYEHVFYLDPDIFIYDPKFLVDYSASEAKIVLLPHLTSPLEHSIDELASLKYGIYNLGFLYVENSEIGKSLAKWWHQRCLDECFEDISGNVWTDQTFFDVAPAFFDGLVIDRDPLKNIAYWNYYEREEFLLEPPVFMHWSAKDFDDPCFLSKKSLSEDRITLSGELLELSRQYNEIYSLYSKQDYHLEGNGYKTKYFFNPLYSRLVSSAKIKPDLDSRSARLGTSKINAKNVGSNRSFSAFAKLFKLFSRIIGLERTHELSRLFRYLGNVRELEKILSKDIKKTDK